MGDERYIDLARGTCVQDVDPLFYNFENPELTDVVGLAGSSPSREIVSALAALLYELGLGGP